MRKLAALLLILMSTAVFAATPKWTRWELSDKYNFQYDPAIWTRSNVEGADVLCLNAAPACTTYIDPHVFAGENGATFETMFAHVYMSTVTAPDVQEVTHGKFDSQTEEGAFFAYLKGPWVVSQYAFPGTTKKHDDPNAIVFIGVFPTAVQYQDSVDVIEAVVKTFTIKTCMLPEGCK